SLHVVALADPAAEEVLAWHADVVEVDGASGRGVRAHLAERLRDVEPRALALDQKRLDAPRAVLLELRVDHEDCRVRRVGDEGLLAIDHKGVAVGARRRPHRAEGDGPGAGLRDAPRPDDLPAHDPRP